MKSFPADLNNLLTVAAGVVDERGVLLEANAGFRRLLPAELTQPIGASVSRFFIQPPFAKLIGAANGADHEIFRGLMTVGNYAGRMRSLIGQVWRTAASVRSSQRGLTENA